MTGRLWFVMAVALGVPLALWLRGRAVARHLGQPLFAERWWAFRRLGTFLVTFGCALLAVDFVPNSGASELVALGYAAFATGCLVVWYVLRRRVFAET
jgi:hypothetical protein